MVLSHPSVSQQPKIIHTPPTIAARKSPKKSIAISSSFGSGAGHASQPRFSVEHVQSQIENQIQKQLHAKNEAATMGIRAREALGSPGMAGDNGEDDGMALDFEPRQQPPPAGPPHQAQSSIVDSAERRDKVSMVFENNKSFDGAGRAPRRRGAKSAVAGNFLRVRSTSGTTKPNGFGVGRDSVVSNAVNNPKEHFDYFYKIIVIGDECVGKTNFLLRMVHGFYDPKPKTTYGVEYETKTVQLPDSNQSVKA